MQSCWLPPSQRPSVAEIFLLLSSLLAAERGMARGSVGEEDEEDEEYEEGRGRRGESEESFERRWDLLRPPAFQTAANERQREREYIREDRDNSYPLLDPVGNCITPSSSELDDILTVTETSKGLNFEYFWEKAHARRGYKPLPPPQPIPTVNNNHRQSLDTPTVVPVISARSPSLASEYYIRLEEHTPQDKSPTLKGKPQSSFCSESIGPGDMELVEIRSGMLGKERVPYCSSDKCGKGLQTVRSSEVQLQVPNTGVAEFRDTSSRVTDFSVVDLGDDDEEEKKKGSEADKKSSTSSQAPVLPPKPRSMSMSSANHLHSRPLPAPPLGYRGLPHYTISGKIETEPHHMSSCPPSTFDHLGLHRSRQTLPPSPSLSPSLPPSSHPIYPQPPQMCPPPLPPHNKPQRSCPSYNVADAYSRYSKPQLQKSNRDPLSCDLSDRESVTRHAAPLHNSKETSHSRSKNFDSPVRRENPLRPIYRNLPRSQPTDPQVERQSSSSPTYSDEDDSPFMSPERTSGGTTVTHSSLSEDADPASSEPFFRGMKRTQSRLDTILPAIWKEDAELQAERVAAAKKSPMHLFLTEISTVAESSESKTEASWEGEKEQKRDGERWGNFVLPNRGMRRSRSLITELGSAGQSWGPEKHINRTGVEQACTVTKESIQRELFLTEIDTGRMDTEVEGGSESDPVKYLYPAGSRLRPYVCAPGFPSYTEAEEAYSKGIRRSRSLLSEITIGKQESEPPQSENEPRRPEMTREEFLKEIQSAETFLTEIISRQNASANKKEAESSYSPTPLSPEYESICIDPNSAQTIQFQSESSIRASSKGKDDTQTEAIYAQVTKRAKKSEIKVSMRPEIPILHIGSNKQSLKLDSQGNNADHCQSGEFVFSEIMPKNGLLHNQTLACQKEDEECVDGPALPARGEQTDLSEESPVESSETVKESNTVILRENKSLFTNTTNAEKAAVTGNGDDKDVLSKGLETTQRDDSGIFHSESKKSTLLSDDPLAKDCVDLIDKLFSALDDEPLKGLPHSGGYQIDNHYTDGIVSQITDCRHQDSADNDFNLHSKSLADTNILIKSVSGDESKDCMLRPSITDSTSVKEADINLCALDSLQHGDDTVETVAPSNVANGESRLSKLYGIQTRYITVVDETPSGVQASDDGKSVSDKVSGLTCPSWAEVGVEEPKRHEDRSGLDHNELGLRNLCCSDSSENNKTTADTEKQLAAAEMRNAMKEKSPLRGAARGVDSGNNVDKDSCEGLDVKTKELWCALEEDEDRLGSVVVRGEFDCHRFSQSKDLRLWPDENDQWASPEKRGQDGDLRSEFFSGFSNNAWEVGERLVVGQEFWETEENDELAGSEPHPAVLEGCEETWNDETQGLTANLSVKEKWDSDKQQAAQAMHIQQEENIENLGEIDSFNKDSKQEISDIEVENIEIPEQETLQQGESQISSCAEAASDREDLENAESGIDSEAEVRPWLSRQYIEERISIMNVEEDHREMSLPSNPISCPSDLDAQEEIDPQVDNFSSVDFPSPPPSIDLDVQDDKLESLDDSFPSPPLSVTEAEDFSHINLDDFIASTETEPYISSAHNTDVSEPPRQESPPATTQSKGISANLNLPSVHITLHDENELTRGALEDFEKLEQLCCISGDEEETLGELFLGNLELLESLKKTPEQRGSSGGDIDIGREICSSSPEGSRVDVMEVGISDISDAPPMILNSQERLSPQEEKSDILRSSGQTCDVKDQGSLSKMTTKNGLMMQASLVCEERLQFSLSENVKTNVLWGATVKDSVMLRPWGEQISESSELVTVKEQKEDESQGEQEVVSSIQPQIESDETKNEPLTVIEQPEVTPQPTANQAMKAKLARLSLALPPLALTLPLTPTGKGGFGDGAIGNRIGRRRGLSSGSDPDDEEEDEHEDESFRRVIVVTETDVDKRVGLRSLLKSPKEPMDRERDRGRNVSFFDDVTIYLFDQETPTNELSTSAPTSPASVSVKSTKLDLHGPNIKSKESKRKEDLSIKPRSPVGANPVMSSRFTVSPADDPHLV
ncbi:hypothetical protein INR49_032097 [Caranx melampygus]|nr:hypothetical protein INR49_032097 [Caranx melampygus]